MSGEVSFSEFEFRTAGQARLRERAEHAEAMLEKARGIMDNMSKAGAEAEAELAQWRATFDENALADARAKLAELENLRAAAREVLRALLAERKESTLARSIVSEHALARLAALAGTEWP